MNPTANDLAFAILSDNPALSLGELSRKIALAMLDDGTDLDGRELDAVTDAAAANALASWY